MDSPFDALLADLDRPTDLAAPDESPDRAKTLEGVLAASKLLADIAKLLDPTPADHPLHGRALPQEARALLRALVDTLFNIQKRLDAIEQAIEQLEGSGTGALEQPTPTPDASPQPEPKATTPPTPTRDIAKERAALTQEQAAFDAYKAQWEAAFAADPTLRAQHPEVQAYYEQMQAYFAQKEAFLQSV